jgi:putative FmdB family regulatory protein
MPLYDFRCPACGSAFEARTAIGAEGPPCPACGAGSSERVVRRFAIGSSFIRPTGRDAKRRDAERAARESQRQERIQARREQRSKD